MNARGKDFFNDLAERWDDLRSADDNKIAGMVSLAGLQGGGSVLDVGCGTGVLIPHLRVAVGRAGRITAVDFAANMILRARKKFGEGDDIAFIVGDIWTLVPTDRFDAVFCFNFLPHVADKPLFVARVRTLLKDGGSLIIMHDMSRTAVNAIHRGSQVVTNDRLPEGRAVAGMLKDAGYEVRQVIDNEEMYFIKAVK